MPLCTPTGARTALTSKSRRSWVRSGGTAPPRMRGSGAAAVHGAQPVPVLLQRLQAHRKYGAHCVRTCRRILARYGAQVFRHGNHPESAPPETSPPRLKSVIQFPQGGMVPKNLFPLDSARKFEDQEKLGHNRWHPEIPPVERENPEHLFALTAREWFDGAIVNDDSAEDIFNVPLLPVHKLAAPSPLMGRSPETCWWWTSWTWADSAGRLRSAGGTGVGVHRDLREGERRRLPHGPVPGRLQSNLGLQRPDSDVAPRPGRFLHRSHYSRLMGTAPSAALLAKWNKREGDLIATDPHRVPPLALPPEAEHAVLGGLPRTSGPAWAARRPAPRLQGERRQPGHQEPVKGFPDLLPGLRGRREPFGRGPPLFPGRR